MSKKVVRGDIFILAAIVAVLYIVCFALYDIKPLMNSYGSVPPLYDYVNSVLFPFSESIAQSARVAIVVKLVATFVIPAIMIGVSAAICAFAAVSSRRTNKKEMAIVVSWVVAAMTYCVWLVTYHITGWAYFTLLVCGAYAVGSIATIFYIFDRKRSCASHDSRYIYLLTYVMPAMIALGILYLFAGYYFDGGHALAEVGYSLPLSSIINGYIFPFSGHIREITEYSSGEQIVWILCLSTFVQFTLSILWGGALQSVRGVSEVMANRVILVLTTISSYIVLVVMVYNFDHLLLSTLCVVGFGLLSNYLVRMRFNRVNSEVGEVRHERHGWHGRHGRHE